MAIRRTSAPDDPEFREMRRRFLDETADRVKALLEALDGKTPGVPRGEAGLQFRKTAHDLRAAGGAYGFPIVSLYAGEVEDTYLDQGSLESLLALVRMLEESLEQAVSLVG